MSLKNIQTENQLNALTEAFDKCERQQKSLK